MSFIPGIHQKLLIDKHPLQNTRNSLYKTYKDTGLMIEIFNSILPFFIVVACGYGSAKIDFLSADAIASITKFVFYIALPCMLFRFSSGISIGEMYDHEFFWAYICATFGVYLFTFGQALVRGIGSAEAAVEAQSASIGNVGFLGIPMLVVLIGEEAVGPIIFYLALDLIIFGTLIVMTIKISQEGRLTQESLVNVIRGVIGNPMVLAISLGLIWGEFNLPIPGPVEECYILLSGAATPCALFVIGASLADKSAEKYMVAGGLSVLKLVVHPLLMAFFALMVFKVDSFSAGIMIMAAAMPTAGNIYILAQHYGVAPKRVSATILISTAVSVITLSIVIAMIIGGN